MEELYLKSSLFFSKDLLNWSKPELIKLKPYFNFEHDNLYYGGIHKFNDKYIGFPSYFILITSAPISNPILAA